MDNRAKRQAYLANQGFDPKAQLADARTKASVTPAAAVQKPDFFSNVSKSLSGLGNFAVKTGIDAGASLFRGVTAFGQQGIRDFKEFQLGNKANQTVAQAKELTKKFKEGKISAAEYQRLHAKVLAENTKAISERKKLESQRASALDLAKATGETALNVAGIVAGGGGLAGAAEGSGLKGFAARALDMGASKNLASAAVKGQLTKGTIESLPQIAGKVAKKDYAGAGIDTALLLSGGIKGGPLGALSEKAKAAGNIVTKNLYDSHGLYDVVKLKGGKTVNQVMDEVAKVNPKLAKNFEKTLKVGQDLAIQEHGGALGYTAKAIEQNQPGGKKFNDMTIDQFVKALQGNIKTKADVQKQAIKLGLKVPEGTAPVAARLTPEMKAGIAKQLGEADEPAKVLAQLKKDKVIQGPNLPGQIEDIVSSGLRGKELSKAISSRLKSVTPGLDASGNMVKTADGKFLGFAKGAGVVKKPSEVADIVKGKKAPLGAIGNTLEKMGLSTRESSPELQRGLFKKVSDTFKKSVDDSSVSLPGNEVLNKLNALAKDKRGVTDIRQLSWKEVSHALSKDGVTDAESKQILKLYKKSFDSLGLAERGLGGKLTDLNMKYNPIAAPYSRVQSIARYEANPFFKVQEGLETKIGTKIFTGKTAVPSRDYTSTIKELSDSGFFKNAGFGGEGANEFGGVTAKLMRGQKRDLAAGIEAIAGTKPGDVTRFLNDPKNADILQNLKAVVQYPDKGLTSSNFMKALNIAMFPTRYNVKVTQLAVKALAKQPGAVQVKVIKGLKDFNDWSKTPQGIKWASDNSEAIGIIKYLTPIGSIETVGKMLGGNFRDIGTIGGLPFGVISQVIEGQGGPKISTPYLDPKTGEVIPDKIPADAKARAKQALADIINTMFTFPGRQVGSPTSKKELTNTAAKTISFGKLEGGKYNERTRTDLTPAQIKQQAALKAGSGKPSIEKPVMKDRSVNLQSNKPVVITPIYKVTKPKRAKAKATAPGTWRP